YPAKADGTACDDGNACSQTDTCQSGACTGGNFISCGVSDQCHDVGMCDPSNGFRSYPAKPAGTGCSDGNACSQTDTCQRGVCTVSNFLSCGVSDQCPDPGPCPQTTLFRSYPAKADGTACSDGNACSQTDTCQGGVCIGSNFISCGVSDQCHNAGTC